MKRISIRFPDGLHKQLKLDCVAQESSVNSFVVDAVSKQLGTMPAGDDLPAERNFPKEAKRISEAKDQIIPSRLTTKSERPFTMVSGPSGKYVKQYLEEQ